ncbi:NYN domain-containing protein [Paraburkholderia bonniea]|uniref:NYN domain-containing protein n=1 Tax=Paraburkholderia bonniea TaxID=2152891 RepID=UPI0012922026|nr:NYN domain-containing protein [Paraburkholderia bonniea]
MASSPETVSMALFCDFENVALGVRDAKYDKFDIKLVLERLLLKGSIVVKKAYCDWERYKSFKATMHEANFELIEIPHVRQSGKNSADIRLVVDALDLCYTKSHVNTFVIISGDSDFSPLVSKLRENAKQVIGVGVQQSTSDLLIANCDEFIFYDDLVRESQRTVSTKRDSTRPTQPSAKRPPEEEKLRREDLETRRSKAIEMAVQTFDALATERGDSGKIWASVLKNAIKRRKPDFNETYYGFRAFGNLLEEAQARGLLEFGRDEKSGTYVYRSNASTARGDAAQDSAALGLGLGLTESVAAHPVAATSGTSGTSGQGVSGKHETRRKGRGGRGKSARSGGIEAAHEARSTESVATPDVRATAEGEAHALRATVSVGAGAGAGAGAGMTEAAGVAAEVLEQPVKAPRTARGGRKPAARKTTQKATEAVPDTAGHDVPAAPVASAAPDTREAQAVATEPSEKPAAKTTRGRRPRKAVTTTASDGE